METKACDGGKGNVIVRDAVEAEVCPVNRGWSAEVAAFELAFAAFEGYPWLLLGSWRCDRWNNVWTWEEGVGDSWEGGKWFEMEGT